MTGAGGAIVWDRGTYLNATQREMGEGLTRVHLSFRLQGGKLSGGYSLTRIRDGNDQTWLLIKRNDDGSNRGANPCKPTANPNPSGRGVVSSTTHDGSRWFRQGMLPLGYRRT